MKLRFINTSKGNFCYKLEPIFVLYTGENNTIYKIHEISSVAIAMAQNSIDVYLGTYLSYSINNYLQINVALTKKILILKFFYIFSFLMYLVASDPFIHRGLEETMAISTLVPQRITFSKDLCKGDSTR